jgi:hypothetical protein
VKRTFAIGALFLTLASPALAQQATGVGVGIANSASLSRSNAVAISGQGGQGGGGGSAASSLTVNNAAQPAVTTANINENVSGTQTLRNVPSVFAPGLTAAGLETCLGSISAGASVVGVGATFGTTIPDPSCSARLDARTLWSMGLRRAAIARLCLTNDIYRSMPEVCNQYEWRRGPDGVPVALAPETAPLGRGVAYAGGPVEVIEQRTGALRMCNDFDVSRHRCRVWALNQLAAASPRH